MTDYILTCRKCQQEIDLGKKIQDINIQCPNCGKVIIVPPHLRAKSKKGIITFALIFALLLIGGGGFLIEMYKDEIEAKKIAEFELKKKRDAENARLEAEKQKAEKEHTALWLKIVNLCDEKTLKDSEDFNNALSALQEYKNQCTDEEDKAKADEYQNLLSQSKIKALNAVYGRLEKEAEPLVQAGKLEQCAQIYSNYNGPFTGETSLKRMSIAEKYRSQAREMASAECEKQRKIAAAKQAMLSTVSNLLINRKFKSAYNEFQNFPYKESVPELQQIFDDLLNIQNIVMDSFKDEQGKTIKVYLKAGPINIEIIKVEDGILYSKYKSAKIVMIKKIKYTDLNLSEIIKRVARKNRDLANLYYGINLVTSRKFDDAEERFQNAGTLAKPLLEALASLKSLQKKLAEAKRKKISGSPLNIDPNNVPLDKIKIEAAKVYTGARTKESTSWGSNQRIQNILITLRNATGQPVSTGTVNFYVIGEGVINKKTYQIIHTTSKPLKMKLSGSMTIKDEFINKFDDAGVRYGHKSYSWLLVIKDNNGKIKVVKAKHSKFEAAAEKILKIASQKTRKGNHPPQFDGTGKIVKVDPGSFY